MACTTRRKHRCGTLIKATCVDYEGELPERLKDNCLSVEEIIEDIYADLDKIKKGISTEGLGTNCIKYGVTTPLSVLDVLKKHEEKICELTNGSTGSDMGNIDVQSWGLDTSCLATICDRPNIATMKDLLQSMINKICELNSRP